MVHSLLLYFAANHRLDQAQAKVGQKPTGDVVSFTYDELYAEVSSVLDKMGSNEFEELVRIAQVVVTHTLMVAGEIR
jgi:hypothetical protein